MLKRGAPINRSGLILKYRPDIDVLRAVAVVAVVLFHSGYHFALGGYAGVDVFFVISGYLITKKIQGEIAQGRFSFFNFYIDRARRLFPALFVTAAITLLCAMVLMAADHRKEVAQSVVWTALSVSNVFFYAGSGYWTADNILKPLLHTWSLSAEEQFYLFWPLGLVWLSKVPRRYFPFALNVIGATSLVAAMLYFRTDQEAVFFLTPFRLFEFAMGANVVWIERLPRIRFFFDAALSGLGFCMIVGAIYVFRPGASTAHMMLPCAGAALMIYGGTASFIAPVWNNRLSLYIGRISYSIYLVHWPVMVFYQYWRYGQISSNEKIGLVAASVLLAMPLHHFVEQQFRYGRPAARPRYAFAWGSLTLMLTVAGTLVWTMIKPAPAPSSDPWLVAHASLPPCENGLGLCDNPKPKIVLIGDSHAIQYVPAIAEALKENGLSGSLYPPRGNCAFVLDISSAYFDKSREDCMESKADWLRKLQQDDPRVVILAGMWENGMITGFGLRYAIDGKPQKLDFDEAKALWSSKMHATVDLLLRSGRKVLLMGNGPLLNSAPSACFDRPVLLGRFECAKMNVVTDPAIHAFVRQTLQQIMASHPGDVFFFDAWKYLCAENLCALSDGAQTFYKDRHHLTPYGALWLQHHAFSELSAFIAASLKERSG